MFLALDTFTVSSWVVADDRLTVTADGEATISAWDPQDETTARVFDAVLELDLSDLDTIPSTDEEVAAAIAPDAEWTVATDWD
jgi:hypothetical protein